MLPLSPTEECMVRCYRKMYRFTMDGWFWLWTTTLIYANQLRELLCDDVYDNVLPSVIMSTADTYIIGEFAKDNIVAATLVLPDDSEVDFNETHLSEHTDIPITAGDIIEKYTELESDKIRLSVIMMDGSTRQYGWNDQLIFHNRN